MSDDIWSRQFYKALEAVGKLTEVEKLRLANILIAVSDTKGKHSSDNSTALKRLTVEQLPKHTNGAELYKDNDAEDKVFSFENKKLHSTIS